MSIKAAFDEALSRGVELQIKFKNDPNPAPLGPGKIERFEIAGAQLDHIYKMFVPAAMGGKPGHGPIQMVLPIVFDIDDVLWFTEGPLNQDGEKVVTTPKNGGATLPGRTPGGLHIPR
jgi:hypothetical protein